MNFRNFAGYLLVILSLTACSSTRELKKPCDSIAAFGFTSLLACGPFLPVNVSYAFLFRPW